MPCKYLFLMLITALSLSAGCSKNGSTFPTNSLGTGAPALEPGVPMGTIAAVVVGFESDRGQAQVALFRGGEGFPGDAGLAYATLSLDITGRRVVVEFDGLPYGEYAISIVHDEDGDGRLNTNVLGIPSEALGVSNDARGRFGPPSYEDAAIVLDGPSFEQTITVDTVF